MNVPGANFQEFGSALVADPYSTILSILPSPVDSEALSMIACFMAFQLMLLKLMPGKDFVATVTPAGNRPVYPANGMASFVVTFQSMKLHLI